MNETILSLSVRMSSRVRFSVKPVCRLLLHHFSHMLYNNDMPLLALSQCSCYICSDYQPLFFFSAGVGGGSGGGGVLRQVQGLVSNTLVFSPLSTSFVFHSMASSYFRSIFNTHTPGYPWVHKCEKPSVLSLKALFSLFLPRCYSSICATDSFYHLTRLVTCVYLDSNQTAVRRQKRLLQMRFKLHVKYTNLTLLQISLVLQS